MSDNAVEIALGLSDLDIESYAFQVCQTYTEPKGPYVKKDVVYAVLHANGNLGKAAKLLGRSRGGLKRWIDAQLDVQELLLDMKEARVDNVEEKQYELADLGDGAAGRFILQTAGKERGFTSRSELTGKDGKPLQTENTQLTADLKDLPAESRGSLLQRFLGPEAVETLSKE